MPRITFTPNLRRHVDIPDQTVDGSTVCDSLEAVFQTHRELRGYIVDDQNGLRKHMVVFVDGQPVKDRRHLQDAVRPDSEIYVMQALSGG